MYFNLKAKNHQAILSSQRYASASGAKSGAKAVEKAAPAAQVFEI
ncbi:YegP family protein [Desulfogranum marinum]